MPSNLEFKLVNEEDPQLFCEKSCRDDATVMGFSDGNETKKQWQRKLPRILRSFPRFKTPDFTVNKEDDNSCMIVIKDVFSLATAPANFLDSLMNDPCNEVSLEEVQLDELEFSDDSSFDGPLSDGDSSCDVLPSQSSHLSCPEPIQLLRPKEEVLDSDLVDIPDQLPDIPCQDTIAQFRNEETECTPSGFEVSSVNEVEIPFSSDFTSNSHPNDLVQPSVECSNPIQGMSEFHNLAKKIPSKPNAMNLRRRVRIDYKVLISDNTKPAKPAVTDLTKPRPLPGMVVNRNEGPTFSHRMVLRQSSTPVKEKMTTRLRSSLTFNKEDERVKRPLHYCKICGKGLKSARSLLDHSRTHSSERPFKCSTCGQSFRWAVILKRHMLRHTGERPYKCFVPKCSKQFRSITNLRSHERLHRNERPFQCDQCTWSFSDQSSFNRHKRTHATEFRCDNCGREFTRNNSLFQHRRACLRNVQA